MTNNDYARTNDLGICEINDELIPSFLEEIVSEWGESLSEMDEDGVSNIALGRFFREACNAGVVNLPADLKTRDVFTLPVDGCVDDQYVVSVRAGRPSTYVTGGVLVIPCEEDDWYTMFVGDGADVIAAAIVRDIVAEANRLLPAARTLRAILTPTFAPAS